LTEGPSCRCEVVSQLIRRKRSIWTGLGKSGYAAQLLAATAATAGLASNYIHAEDLLRGEISTLRADEVLLAISWSAKSEQIVEILTRTSFATVLITSARPCDIAVPPNYYIFCDHVKDELLNRIPAESILETLRVGYGLIAGATTSSERSFALQSGHPHGALSREIP
jgi:arabinose-5-phosphate isomerase